MKSFIGNNEPRSLLSSSGLGYRETQKSTCREVKKDIQKSESKR